MRVTVVKDYRTIFNVTDKNNNGETYIVRFQDNALPTIHGDSLLEIYGDGGAIRELSKSLTGLETKRSFQIDAYSIASTPIYVNEGVLYIACNSGEGLFHIHDWVAPRLTCNFNTVLDVNKQPLLISRYLGYSDGGLSVFTTEQIGVVVSKDNKGNRINKGIDVLKVICIIYPNFSTSVLRFKLGDLNFHDILPMKGYLVKFDRSKKNTDIHGETNIEFKYYTNAIKYEGKSLAIKDRVLLSNTKPNIVKVKLPRPVIGFCGMNVIKGRHLILYKLTPLDKPKSSYVLIEISWENGEFFISSMLEFHY